MLTRRSFLHAIIGGGALTTQASVTWAQARAHIVIIGGGFGGTTCAKYLRRLDNKLAVTLVAPQRRFFTCPLSNAALIDLRALESLSYGYEQLRARYGVRVIHAHATEFDPVTRQVHLSNGRTLRYDRLVLAPGAELQWNAVEGYDETASRIFPHAWEAGPQTAVLRRQLQSMPDGGVVVISVPDNPYRCPPGPYERASLIAYYLKQHKPKSKVLILDSKDLFTKHELFHAAWKQLYPGLLEWVAGSQGGRTQQVDTRSRVVRTELEEYRPAVANIIPPQRAAAIARHVGLDAGKGWCSVRATTFESTVHANVHVIGDAAIASPMPKSAFAANVHAKVCAAAIVSLLRSEPVSPPVLMNTCYSLVAPNYGISITGAYRAVDEAITTIPGTDGISPLEAPAETRALEAEYARSWYVNITTDTFT